MKSSNCRDYSDHKSKCCKPVIQALVEGVIFEPVQVISGTTGQVIIKFDGFPIQKKVDVDQDLGGTIFTICKSGVYNVQYGANFFVSQNNNMSNIPNWSFQAGIAVNTFIESSPASMGFNTELDNNNGVGCTTQSRSKLIKLEKGDRVVLIASGQVEQSDFQVIIRDPSLSLEYVGNY